MNPQNKTRALAVRALIDLHQAHCCQKSKGSALFNLASAIMIQLFAEKYTITPYGSFPNCKRAANFYGNESVSKLTTESGTNECSTVSIEGSWRFPHMFSLSFVLAGDATRNKLCSKPFRDLITQILHFSPDQRKQRLESALLRVPSAVEADWDCHLHIPFIAGARFYQTPPHLHNLAAEGTQLCQRLKEPIVEDRPWNSFTVLCSHRMTVLVARVWDCSFECQRSYFKLLAQRLINKS